MLISLVQWINNTDHFNALRCNIMTFNYYYMIHFSCLRGNYGVVTKIVDSSSLDSLVNSVKPRFNECRCRAPKWLIASHNNTEWHRFERSITSLRCHPKIFIRFKKTKKCRQFV